MLQLHGPFRQALTLANLPIAGPLRDADLEIIADAGILCADANGEGARIIEVGSFAVLRLLHPEAQIVEPLAQGVVTPGLVDAHTHLVWAGTRAQDFALRNAGATYLELAAAGGGILSTVKATRAASLESLGRLLDQRLDQLAQQGIRTVEVKTGYGLSVEHELAQLELLYTASAKTNTSPVEHMAPAPWRGTSEDLHDSASAKTYATPASSALWRGQSEDLHDSASAKTPVDSAESASSALWRGQSDDLHDSASAKTPVDSAIANISTVDLVPTCLAAHVCPPEFAGRPGDYLLELENALLPALSARFSDEHAHPQRTIRRPRIDAFAEPSTFWGPALERYLLAARSAGFALTLHADQFTAGGAALAARLGAQSADHLEHIDEAGISALAASAKTRFPTVAVALPGASMGLGEPFTPARRLLDAGACLAIASDWNPGSAPQGQLLVQATVLGVREKLSNAEVWAAITFRAAQALGLLDRGRLAPGQRADFIVWPVDDYREITWQMGSLRPVG